MAGISAGQIKKYLNFINTYLLEELQEQRLFTTTDYNKMRDSMKELYYKERMNQWERGVSPYSKWAMSYQARYDSSMEFPTIKTLTSYGFTTIEKIEHFEMVKHGEVIEAKRYYYKVNQQNCKNYKKILELLDSMEK